MINVTNKGMKAWYEMLNGNISVPVYRGDAPASQEGNYVLLRVESESDNSNNSKFVTNPIIITDVVTKFPVAVKDGVAADIDTEIAMLLFPSVGQLGLPAQSGIQFTEVTRTDATYLYEDDGTFKYHRLVTRNRHRVVQLDETLGAELITNGSFTGNANGWSTGTGWAYFVNNVKKSGSSATALEQVGFLTTGSRYRVYMDVGGSAGFITVSIGSNFHQSFNAGVGGITFDTDQVVANILKISILASTAFDGTIDNVSVKEIL